MRRTLQRQVIYDILTHSHGPMTPLELLVACQVRLPDIGIATIHRAIKRLSEEGKLERVEMAGEPLRFCWAEEDHHHHHFKCRGCGTVSSIHRCLEDFKRLLPRGFTHEAHDITIYGRCGECA